MNENTTECLLEDTTLLAESGRDFTDRWIGWKLTVNVGKGR